MQEMSLQAIYPGNYILERAIKCQPVMVSVVQENTLLSYYGN